MWNSHLHCLVLRLACLGMGWGATAKHGIRMNVNSCLFRMGRWGWKVCSFSNSVSFSKILWTCNVQGIKHVQLIPPFGRKFSLRCLRSVPIDFVYKYSISGEVTGTGGMVLSLVVWVHQLYILSCRSAAPSTSGEQGICPLLSLKTLMGIFDLKKQKQKPTREKYPRILASTNINKSIYNSL